MAERARKPASRTGVRSLGSEARKRRTEAAKTGTKPAPRSGAATPASGPEGRTRPAGEGRPKSSMPARGPRAEGGARKPAATTGARKPGAASGARKAAPRKPSAEARKSEDGLERLQKILAHAGIASRRACEQLILEGHVQVNGKTITELGTRADPRRDEITVDYRPIEREALVYILMNKPKGYITTVKDEQGRPTVMALLHGVPGRVYPVGRLDFNSEGLLLMTNDGELANRLMAPDHEIPKVYLVKVHRIPTPDQIKELSEGFRLDGRRLKPCRIEFAEKADNPWLKVTLTEGKNLQLRRMFAAIGHPVSKLRRIQFGPIADPALKPGEWRFLEPGEIAAITSF
ncbi:MAG TPA: pseudouridine synthase [Holophagaceae bacterium]|nr:pseudouridine synthase [Holophagaceae bacterium]